MKLLGKINVFFLACLLAGVGGVVLCALPNSALEMETRVFIFFGLVGLGFLGGGITIIQSGSWIMGDSHAGTVITRAKYPRLFWLGPISAFAIAILFGVLVLFKLWHR